MRSLLTFILYICIAISAASQTAVIKQYSYGEAPSDGSYSINISYPKVDFGPDALMGVRGIAEDINNCVDTLRQNLISDFMKEVKNTPKDAPCANNTSGLNTTFKTIYNNSELFSFSFETSSSPACANHPYNFMSSLNYSTTSIGAFGFEDIFKKDSDYLKFVSDYCIKALKEKAAADKLENNDAQITEGASPKSDNFRVFNVNQTELIIYFNPYKVGPWVWGIQSVSIPLSELKSMVDPSGPLASLVK